MFRLFKKFIFTSSAFLLNVCLAIYTNIVTSDWTPPYVFVLFGLILIAGGIADFRKIQKEEKEKRLAEARDEKVAEQVGELHAKFILQKTEFIFLPEDRMEISSLPDLHPHFVGRAAELALLDACWQNPSANLLEFVAPGGTGKTTLVTWWLLNRLPALDAQPDAIFAFSFYSQGTGDQRQSSSDTFFSRANAFFGVEKPPTDPRERALALVKALRARRSLLVLDGIEPLQYPPGPLEGQLKDPALRYFLKELAAAQPGLCICTTRVALGELAGIAAPSHQNREVENLDEAAGVDLLRQIGARGPERDLKAAVQAYKGHALALRLLGNYVAARWPQDPDIRKRDQIERLFKEKKSGLHASHVMEAYVKWFEENVQSHRVTRSHPVTKSPEVALLRMLGLFDRPAPVEALEALLAAPDIAGLTEGLRDCDEEALRDALNNLARLGLLSEIPLPEGGLPKNLPQLPALRHTAALDAHPLVREHFGEMLEQKTQKTWREANLRLFEYYRNLPEKHLPDTLEEMEPLFLAMAHGARAREQQKALDEVYYERIKRKDEHFSTKKLGAFGADLTALAHLFERVWSQPSRNMTEADQAVVLSWAGFRLRGLGRLFEAAEPMKACLNIYIAKYPPIEVAIAASNLSELYLTLGQLPEAVKYGRQAVEYADRSDDWGQKMINKTTLADALHQSGQPEEALRWFEEAETMQWERRPEYRFLYGPSGFQYCDLLLGLGKWKEVLERAKEGLKNRDTFYSLLDIALDQLSIGRAHAFAAAEIPTNEQNEGAEQFLNLAVEGLRKAGTIHRLPLGLLARAAWHRQCSRYAEAHTDLAEVLDIAESGGMRLYLVDYHIEMARLLQASGKLSESLKLSESWEQHKAKALRLIEKTGYLRRLKEAEEV